MRDGSDPRLMNLCDKFFKTQMKNGVSDWAEDALKRCDSMDLTDTHFTKATVLVHELTHTTYTMAESWA